MADPQNMVPQFESQDIPEVPVSEDVNSQPVQEPVIGEVTPTVTPAPGSKTDPALLLQSLKEEREKRQALEKEIQTLQTSSPSSYIPEEAFSDEGKILLDRVRALEAEKETAQVLSAFPQLKDKTEEFEAFKGGYPGIPLEKVAKVFLAENGMLAQPRKGLERGGAQRGTPTSGEMTPEDTEKLRTTQPRKYLQMIQSGKLNPDKIKY